ncbi:MAG: MarR family transcriptional regulator [Bacteroidales bacterium]|nr:MarR family transcriptional regulator [Bacteroidales bacterium]
MNIQETVDFHLRSTLFATRRMYNLLAAENGITQGIGYVLINVGKEGVPATKIAPMMGMSTSSLSRLLKTMEDDGLIYRESNEEDRRVVKVFLTPRGVELRSRVRKVVVEFNKKLSEKIDPADMEAFVRVNETIRQQVCNDLMLINGDNCNEE